RFRRGQRRLTEHPRMTSHTTRARRLKHHDVSKSSRYTHYLFRYPAKFHPPVVAKLIQQYSKVGDAILDPFCGSGTLLVEAVVNGRQPIGMDIDPVAVFIARAKTQKLSPRRLRASASKLMQKLANIRRLEAVYDRYERSDI